MLGNIRFYVGRWTAAALLLAAACVGGAGGARALVLYGTDNGGNFYSVNPNTAALTLLGNLGDALGALEFHPNGTLYGFGVGDTSTLYTVDPFAVLATPIGDNGEFVFEGGLAFAPDGTAYGTNRGSATTPTLFTIDLGTGAGTDVGQISGGDHDIDGLVMRSDGALVGLDRVTNSLLAIDTTSAVAATIAAAPATVGDVGGLTTIDGLTGFMTIEGALYGVDLYTGASNLIGSDQIVLRSLAAFAEIPAPATMLLFGVALAGLGAARRRAAEG